MDTQLIAHDKEVYDFAWGGLGVFATVSADGSVRVFDLRCAFRLVYLHVYRHVCSRLYRSVCIAMCIAVCIAMCTAAGAAMSTGVGTALCISMSTAVVPAIRGILG